MSVDSMGLGDQLRHYMNISFLDISMEVNQSYSYFQMQSSRFEGLLGAAHLTYLF